MSCGIHMRRGYLFQGSSLMIHLPNLNCNLFLMIRLIIFSFAVFQVIFNFELRLRSSFILESCSVFKPQICVVVPE